ncbi:MAG: glycosyltransferase family 39 protein [Deltaproteobacteria bacterium]|nr:glycosyltransferase family 39 protein [Deltaproteobacteria bacterium]MBW2533543.1 glycosyltransferase family 39 protein [Deltaproteobacteria bacterium]
MVHAVTQLVLGRRRGDLVLALVVAAYWLAAALLISDYGLTWDEPENFGIGHKYLHFYRTGHLDLTDGLPPIPHSDAYDHPAIRRGAVSLWPFANVLSAASCELLHQLLGWLDAVAAHHLVIPALLGSFAIVLYRFAAKRWGRGTGVAAVAVLLTMPRVFGHGMNNVKDVPQLALFGLTLLLLYEWISSQRRRYLMAGAVTFALALATKADALLIPLVVLVWLAPEVRRSAWKSVAVRRAVRDAALAVVGSLVLAALCYPPLLSAHVDQLRGLAFLVEHVRYVLDKGADASEGWNLYAPRQLLYTTPPLTLLLAIVGSVRLFRSWRRRSERLILVWLTLVVGRHCLPGTAHYDAVRHVLVAMPALALAAALGMGSVAAALERRRPQAIWRHALAALALLVAGVHTAWLVALHPYQTSYYSPIVGGLGGAQRRALPYACDYWLSSFREAGHWLDEHASAGATYYAVPNNRFMRHAVSRADLHHLVPPRAELPTKFPADTYLVVVPRRMARHESLLRATRDWPTVFRIERQRGEILSIRRQPRAGSAP